MDDSRASHAALVAIVGLFGIASVRAQAPDSAPHVARLVKTLGAEDFAARRAADLELLKMGREGHRQLEAAAASSDPEIRLRALNLLERIAAIRLWEPTRVTLKAEGEKASNVLAACAEQTGNHVFFGDPFGEFTNALVSIDCQEKPYWQALDLLAAQTGNHLRVHYDTRMPGIAVAAGRPGNYPTAYSGPVRAQITRARRDFVEEFDYERLTSEVTHTFQLNLQMMWEDRFRLVAYGALPELVEAKTDTGVAVSGPQSTSGGWNVASSGTRQVSASLRLNPPPVSATKLSVLRLKWSLVALGDMAVAELDNPTAKSESHHDGLSLCVLALDRQANGRVELTLLVSRNIAVPDPPEILFQENEIELLDPNGRSLRSQSQSHTLTDRGAEFRLTFLGDSPGAVPAKLRVKYPKIRSRRDLEIVFHDVPLPREPPE